MRKFVRTGAAVAASVALVTMLAPASAEAASKKRGDLKICFDNDTALAGLAFDAVADGPSFRSKTLQDGDCKKWDVRAGQYKITQDNVREFYGAAFVTEPFPGDVPYRFAACPGEEFRTPRIAVEVTRNGEDYDAVEFERNATLTTNVQKDRRTKVEFTFTCAPLEGGIILL